MKAKNKDLRSISKITEASFRAQQAALAPLLARERSLRRLIDELEGERSADAGSQPVDPVMLAKADLRWRTWAAKRRQDLDAELARTLAAQAVGRASLQQAFGRYQAINELLRRAERDDKSRVVQRERRGQ